MPDPHRTCGGSSGSGGTCDGWIRYCMAVMGFAAALASTLAAAAPNWTLAASGLSAPVEILHAGDGTQRLFVIEQGGRIRVLSNGQLLGTPYLDLGALTAGNGERGLLGAAFHPRYASDRRVFVNYTRAADGATVIASYRASAANPDRADTASAVVLLTIPQPYSNHNGGALQFGPDGLLYIGLGDGGSANDPEGRAQDPGSLLGKILRIDVDHGSPYAIPPGNPFAGGGGRPEIFAVGVRNPWRMSFDRATGDLWIGDVGQDAAEEVDRLPAGMAAGANLGWRVLEGNRCTGLSGPVTCANSSLTAPVITYGHAEGCSVTGGYVYRGSGMPSLHGQYIYADFCSGRLWAARRDAGGTWVPQLLEDTGFMISGFGEDESAELYFADYGSGNVYKLVEAGPVAALEFYHAAFDHYFVTTLPADIAALDSGRLSGWVRTGLTFNAFPTALPGTQPVCRYYLPPAVGDSHFFSASPVECAEVGVRFPSFTLETAAAMYMVLPDPATGACPVSMTSVYRLWNGRGDSNHRYTTAEAVRDQMLAQGYVPEGYGPGAVAMCAP